MSGTTEVVLVAMELMGLLVAIDGPCRRGACNR